MGAEVLFLFEIANTDGRNLVLQTEPTAQVHHLAKAPQVSAPRVSLPIPSVESDHKRTRDGIVLVHSIMARRRLRRLGRIRGRLLP
jgi:hypothetical protein